MQHKHKEENGHLDKLQKNAFKLTKSVFRGRASDKEKEELVKMAGLMNQAQQALIDKKFKQWKEDREANKNKLHHLKDISTMYIERIEKLEKKEVEEINAKMGGAFLAMYKYMKKQQKVQDMTDEQKQEYKMKRQLKKEKKEPELKKQQEFLEMRQQAQIKNQDAGGVQYASPKRKENELKGSNGENMMYAKEI